MLRQALILLFLGVVAAAIVARIDAEPPAMVVPVTTAPADGAVLIDRGLGGHFFVTALVDGVEIEFLVDSGASLVVLSPSDARRLGLALDEADFSERYQTANGVVSAAPVTLARISIAGIELDDVAAAVNGAELRFSLLGQSFLQRLSRVEIERNRMRLEP